MSKKDHGTQATEEESFYSSVMSTCCCVGSYSGDENSFTKNNANNTNTRRQQQPQHEFDDFEQPKFWDRLSDAARYLVGTAPPVKFVKCFECSSVDESEVTLPRVLSNMADEYDKNNKWHVNSIWSISEDQTVSTAKTNDGTNGSKKSRRSRSRGRTVADRLDRLRKGRSSDKSRLTDDSTQSKRSFKDKAIGKGSWSRSSKSSKRSRSSNRSNSTRCEV